MCDGNGLAERLLGLEGFVVLDVDETDGGELIVTVETTADRVGCSGCGVRAEAQDRMPVTFRDLECFGHPARLVWVKRRWRCLDPDCEVKTWTETSDAVASRVLLSRAAIDVPVKVGRDAQPVAGQARRFGVAWATVHTAVAEFGRPLVDDPGRVGVVSALGVDETSFKTATRTSRTQYVTGLVDLDAKRVIDMVPGRSASDLKASLRSQPRDTRVWSAPKPPARGRTSFTRAGSCLFPKVGPVCIHDRDDQPEILQVRAR